MADFPTNPSDWDYVWAGLNLAAANVDAAVDPSDLLSSIPSTEPLFPGLIDMSGDTLSELTDYSAFSEFITPLSPAWQPESIYSPSTVSSLSEYNHLFSAGGYAPSVAESEKTVTAEETPKFTRGSAWRRQKADRITNHGRMAEPKCDQCRSVRGIVVECIHLGNNTKCASPVQVLSVVSLHHR